MAKKKRIPAVIYNNSDYKYPKGLRVTDEDDMDKKLKSGEFNTGPVDLKKNGGTPLEVVNKDLSDSEKRAEIERLTAELGDDLDIKKTDPAPVKETTPKEKKPEDKKSTKKPLSHMNLTELMREAGESGVKIDEDWTKTQLYEAIKKKKG